MDSGEVGLRDRALRAAGEIVADCPERADGILERLAERLEPLAGLLQAHERDERAQDFVRALEDHVDSRVADGLLVRIFLGIANAARDLERVVRGAKRKLRREDLARGALERK